MKKILAWILLIALTSCATTFVGYAIVEQLNADIADYKITLNGKELSFNSPVITINGSTYLPLREFCNALEIGINWIGEENKIEIVNDKSITDETGLYMKDFKFIKYDMDMSEIYKIVGEPDSYEGSGVLWGVYQLNDGNKLHLNDRMSGKLKVVTLETVDGCKIPIEFNEDGTLNVKGT